MTKGPPIKLPKLKFKGKSKSRGSSRSASPQSASPTQTNPQEYSVTPVISETQANSPQQAQISILEYVVPHMISQKLRRASRQPAQEEHSESQPSEVQEQTIQEADGQQSDEERKQEGNCEWEDSQYQECLRKNSENCQLMYDVLIKCQSKFY